MLNTYQKKKKKKFLRVSLAHFENDKYKEELNTDGEDSEPNSIESKELSILEWKILNQVIHQIDEDIVRDTNFPLRKVSPKEANKQNCMKSLFLTVFIALLMYIVRFNQIKNFLIDNLKLDDKFPIIFMIVSVLSLLICIFFCIKWVINMVDGKINLKRLKIFEHEIEMFDSKEQSYFNKYLNEVLFIFEHSQKQAIVFEDIDRYNNNEIFAKLREINFLINEACNKENKENNCNQTNKKKRKIHFIYLIRDNIFTNKDRTKFFDFILPIVPVVTSSNAGDRFIKLFDKRKDIAEQIDSDFINEVSLFLNDMRIIKNIFNEFIVYYERINDSDINCNNLLAIIIFKNLFPDDFNDLQENRGFIYSYLDEQNLVKIKNKEEERLNLEFKNKANDIAKLTRTSDNRDIISKYEDEKEKIEARISNLRYAKIKDIIYRDNADIIFKHKFYDELNEEIKFDDIKKNQYFPALKYLIREGYINEHYSDYITYFLEDRVKKADYKFWQKVVQKESLEFDYKIENPEYITKKVAKRFFNEEETLNIYLVDYLLENEHENIDLIMNQIKIKKHIDFIYFFLEHGKRIDLFIEKIHNIWTELWDIITNDKNYDDSKKREYLLNTLYYTDEKDLKEMNDQNELTDYISKQDDFLAIESPDVERIVDALKILEVKLEKLDYDNGNKDLLVDIYINDLYELNFSNIKAILNQTYGDENEEEYKHKNYTWIRKNKELPLSKYIEQEIDVYIEEVLANCEKQIYDKEEDAIQLLNNADLSSENKETYIEYLNTGISTASDIADFKLVKLLLENNIIKYNIINIVYVYSQVTSQDIQAWLDFVNSSDINIEINYETVRRLLAEYSELEDEEEKNELADEFYNYVIKEEKLNNDKYNMIMKGFGHYYNEFTI